MAQKIDQKMGASLLQLCIDKTPTKAKNLCFPHIIDLHSIQSFCTYINFYPAMNNQSNSGHIKKKH